MLYLATKSARGVTTLLLNLCFSLLNGVHGITQHTVPIVALHKQFLWQLSSTDTWTPSLDIKYPHTKQGLS